MENHRYNYTIKAQNGDSLISAQMEEVVFALPEVKVEIKVEADERSLMSVAEGLGLSLEAFQRVDVDPPEETRVKVEAGTDDLAYAALPMQRGKRQGVAKRFQCEMCSFKSRTHAGLKAHQRREAHRAKLRCNICAQGFPRLSELQSHRRERHANEKPFECDECGRSYAYKANLFTHVKMAHLGVVPEKKVHACRLCEKVYAFPRSLHLHMAAHAGTNVFICDVCGKSLTNRDHLKFHRRIHTGEKPYVCETCGKGFCKSCNLTLHRRVHTGEKPYVCDCCKKAFSQRSTLVIHMRLHTGQKPYVCFVCQRAFICRALLNVHLKNHRV